VIDKCNRSKTQYVTNMALRSNILTSSKICVGDLKFMWKQHCP
jgi:hypothetical protein